MKTSNDSQHCILIAFADVLGLELEEMIEQIGHDGSEIVRPEMGEPMCRRGFHIQECIRVAYGMGKSVTPIEIHPCSMVSGSKKVVQIEPVLKLFEFVVRSEVGVITGNGSRCGHAVSFQRGLIRDQGDVYEYSQSAFFERGFISLCAWIVK